MANYGCRRAFFQFSTVFFCCFFQFLSRVSYLYPQMSETETKEKNLTVHLSGVTRDNTKKKIVEKLAHSYSQQKCQQSPLRSPFLWSSNVKPLEIVGGFPSEGRESWTHFADTFNERWNTMSKLLQWVRDWWGGKNSGKHTPQLKQHKKVGNDFGKNFVNWFTKQIYSRNWWRSRRRRGSIDFGFGEKMDSDFASSPERGGREGKSFAYLSEQFRFVSWSRSQTFSLFIKLYFSDFERWVEEGEKASGMPRMMKVMAGLWESSRSLVAAASKWEIS